MFGYVTPLTDELKVKEHIFYKSIYCGLCKCMGKRVCSESRMTLSYDIVFLALIRLALAGENLEFETGRCAVSPFKKRVFLKRNPTLDYCAAAGALLAYHNLADNVADSRGVRRLGARLLLLSAKKMRKKASLPELDAVIKDKLRELSALENAGETSLDAASEKFGELLAEVFAYGLEENSRRISGQIGFHVGKWIYAADAADDFEKDRKNGEYNPLSEVDKASLRCSMNLELEAVSAAEALISFSDIGIKNVTENIIYLGMPSRMEKILSRYPD